MDTPVSKLERTFRLDSSFYAKENIILENKLHFSGARTISSIVDVSDGNHLAISEEFSDTGIPYYRGQDIYSFFIEQTPSPLRIPTDVFNAPFMHRSHLQCGDVLMSIVGAIIGNVSLVKTDSLASCSCKLAILRPIDIKSELLAIFLQSTCGQKQVERFRRGGGQTGFLLEDFDQMLIPNFLPAFIEKIQIIVNNVSSLMDKAKQKYSEAENILLEELGFKDWTPSKKTIAHKTFADFQACGRFDAEYYQPKYDEIECKIKSYHNGFALLDKHFRQKTKGFELKDQFYNYIEIGDINIISGQATYNNLYVDELPANAKYEISPNDILVSKVRPYRGAVAIIDYPVNDLIASGAFTVLQENGSITKETLFLLLRIDIYKDWLLKWNVGSSYPVIKDEDILNLPIPFVRKDIQKVISAKVQESFALRAESQRLLDLAKHTVEVAIEQGEDVALNMIQGGS